MKKILLFHLAIALFFIAFFEAVSYGADKFSGYYNQAIEYYKQGKYDQAGKQFEMALELKPNDAYALYGLGNTYYCKAKYDEAIKIYTKAIRSNPDYAKVHYSLSLAYNKMGMTQEAEKEKKIFRKISQGEKGAGKSSAHAKTSRSPVKIDEHASETKRSHSEFGLAKSKQAEQEKSEFDSAGGGHASEPDEAVGKGQRGFTAEQSHGEEDAPAFSSKRNHAARGADRSFRGEKRGTEGGDSHSKESAEHTFVEHNDATNDHVISTHGTKKHMKEEGAHTIFQGYTKEPTKSKSKLFVKKHGKPYGYDISPVVYMKSKWSKSGVNKIFVCVIGYICVTQMWLSIIAIFGFVVWRIRKKNLVG